MRVILFGATGMVGQGVLREYVLDPGVAEVLAVTRSGMGPQPAKVSEMSIRISLTSDWLKISCEAYDACFFCLGVSSVGMREAEYTRLTHDLTMCLRSQTLRGAGTAGADR